MMWNALRSGCQHHQHHLHPSEPAVARAGCRTTAQNSKSKPAEANTQPGPNGRRQADAGSEQSRGCVYLCVCMFGGASFKANSGTQLLVEGIRSVCVDVCVWECVAPLRLPAQGAH